jgi:hypothetical protein
MWGWPDCTSPKLYSMSKEGTMRRLVPVRILTVAALAISATIGTLALATRAGAISYATCNSLSGLNLPGQPESVSGCTGPTGGSGVILVPLTSPITVSWASGGTTTISFATKIPKKSKCAVGSTEMSLHGHAKISTGPTKEIRGMFFATVCVDPSQNLSMMPGKLMLFQS